MRALTRREWLTITGIGSGVIAAMLTVPAIGFVASPLFQRTRRVEVKVGTIDHVPVGVPTALQFKISTGETWDTTPIDRIVYVLRREDGSVKALTNVCTHMQCDVHWDTDRSLFLCPCHGGLYSADGDNVGGPPPSPLPQWVHRVEKQNGTTVLFVENSYDERI